MIVLPNDGRFPSGSRPGRRFPGTSSPGAPSEGRLFPRPDRTSAPWTLACRVLLFRKGEGRWGHGGASGLPSRSGVVLATSGFDLVFRSSSALPACGVCRRWPIVRARGDRRPTGPWGFDSHRPACIRLRLPLKRCISNTTCAGWLRRAFSAGRESAQAARGSGAGSGLIFGRDRIPGSSPDRPASGTRGQSSGRGRARLSDDGVVRRGWFRAAASGPNGAAMGGLDL